MSIIFLSYSNDIATTFPWYFYHSSNDISIIISMIVISYLWLYYIIFRRISMTYSLWYLYYILDIISIMFLINSCAIWHNILPSNSCQSSQFPLQVFVLLFFTSFSFPISNDISYHISNLVCVQVLFGKTILWKKVITISISRFISFFPLFSSFSSNRTEEERAIQAACDKKRKKRVSILFTHFQDVKIHRSTKTYFRANCWIHFSAGFPGRCKKPCYIYVT